MSQIAASSLRKRRQRGWDFSWKIYRRADSCISNSAAVNNRSSSIARSFNNAMYLRKKLWWCSLNCKSRFGRFFFLDPRSVLSSLAFLFFNYIIASSLPWTVCASSVNKWLVSCNFHQSVVLHSICAFVSLYFSLMYFHSFLSFTLHDFLMSSLLLLYSVIFFLRCASVVSSLSFLISVLFCIESCLSCVRHDTW